MQIIKCKFCEKNKKLIKAHIIPEGFFRKLRVGDKPPEIHCNKDGVYPKKSPIGIYDKGILCLECDNEIGIWDNYAQNLLLNSFSESFALFEGDIKLGYKIDHYDYDRLKLFFLSVLWRASVSSHNFFKRVDAGPHESILRQMLIDKNPGEKEEYAVILAKFNEPSAIEMLDPHRDKFDHINFYRFYLTGFVSYVKVDKRDTPELLKIFALEKGMPLLILLRDLHKSKDGKIIKKMINSALLKEKGL